MKPSSFINYCFLASIIVVWPLMQIKLIPLGGSGIVQLFFSILALVVSFTDKQFRKNFKSVPILIWLLWVIYTWIRWEASGIKSDLQHWEFVFNYICLTYITLIISYYELQKNLNRTTQYLCVLFLIYVFLGLFGEGPVQFGERGGEVFGNHLPLISCSALFISFFRYRQKYTKIGFPIFFLFLTIIVTLFVSERKVLVPIILITTLSLVPLDIWKKPSKQVFLIVLCMILFLFIDYLMKNTLLGERILMVQEEGESFTDNKYLTVFGDRAYFYVAGWALFLEYPLTGIGLRNFPIFANSNFLIHSEYLVQLVEGGIVGFTIFLAFSLSIIKKLKKTKNHPDCNRQTRLVCLSEILSLSFLCFYAWTYEFPHYFISIAVILSFCDKYSINENNTYKLGA